MNIGIVVEGDSDGAAYPALIQKIRVDATGIRVRVCGDVVKLKQKFVGWLKEFEYRAYPAIDKAIVIMDSDCSDAPSCESLLEKSYEQSRFAPSFPVHFHATKCELESWLLADENAINTVSRNRGKNKLVSPFAFPLETLRNAKESFHKALTTAGLPADSKVYQEVAAAIDIERIRVRCPLFNQFIAKIHAC